MSKEFSKHSASLANSKLKTLEYKLPKKYDNLSFIHVARKDHYSQTETCFYFCKNQFFD